MKILSNKGASSSFEGVIYDALTNNGVVGLPTEDKSVAQLEFRDIFKLPEVFADKGKELELKDAFTTKDLTRFIETQISRVVREAIEPNLVVVPNLFQEIRYEGPGRSVEIGSMGAIHAATVPEGSEYPESEFNFGDGDMVMVGIEKHGLKLRVTQEVIDDNLFDVFGLWLRMSGRALARHKEVYALKLLTDFGYDIYNNSTPTSSQLGQTHGRAIDGTWNDTMNVDDLFEMYAWLYLRGFTPDTLLMNPLSWKMFMTDPETREIVIKNNVMTTNQLPGGNFAAGYGTGHNGLGVRTTATGVPLDDPTRAAGNNPFVTTLNPLGSTYMIEPKYLPSPLRVIVSPHVAYDATNADGAGNGAMTTIIMADSSRTGILLTKEGTSIDDWKDPERDILAMKLKERWGMALFEQGKGIGIARDITVDRNYVFDNVNNVALDDDRSGTGVQA